jgi:hypothetical protein
MKIPRSHARAAALVAVLALSLLAGAAAAQALPGSPSAVRESVTEGCAVCGLTCFKPWSIPDRWDDSGRPGFPEWAGNGRWDSERFDDWNGNQLYDPGEPFTDQNGDGRYTSEYYHPFLTGYVASRDLGRSLVLKPGSPDEAPVPGVYYAIDFDPQGRRGQEGDQYARSIAECWYQYLGPGDGFSLRSGNLAGPTTQGVTDLIARDPSAYWDPATATIQGSLFDVSPRRAYICLHDPRIPAGPGRSRVRIVKIIAMFIEGIAPTGDLTAQFIRVQAPGYTACPPGYQRAEDAFILTTCP